MATLDHQRLIGFDDGAEPLIGRRLRRIRVDEEVAAHRLDPRRQRWPRCQVELRSAILAQASHEHRGRTRIRIRRAPLGVEPDPQVVRAFGEVLTVEASSVTTEVVLRRVRQPVVIRVSAGTVSIGRRVRIESVCRFPEVGQAVAVCVEGRQDRGGERGLNRLLVETSGDDERERPGANASDRQAAA